MLIWYVDLLEHIGIEQNKTLKNICNLFVIDKLMYINIIPALGLQYLLLDIRGYKCLTDQKASFLEGKL